MAFYGSRFKLNLRTICCIKFLAYNLSTRAESPVRLLIAAGFARFFLRLAHVKIEVYNCRIQVGTITKLRFVRKMMWELSQISILQTILKIVGTHTFRKFFLSRI